MIVSRKPPYVKDWHHHQKDTDADLTSLAFCLFLSYNRPTEVQSGVIADCLLQKRRTCEVVV